MNNPVLIDRASGTVDDQVPWWIGKMIAYFLWGKLLDVKSYDRRTVDLHISEISAWKSLIIPIIHLNTTSSSESFSSCGELLNPPLHFCTHPHFCSSSYNTETRKRRKSKGREARREGEKEEVEWRTLSKACSSAAISVGCQWLRFIGRFASCAMHVCAMAGSWSLGPVIISSSSSSLLAPHLVI